MDKKEVYEHLAKIYLDASSKSSKKKPKTKIHYPAAKNLFIGGLISIFVLSSGLFYNFKINEIKDSQLALFLIQDAAKINFNFDPAKKEAFSVALKNLNLEKYNALGFAVRKTNSKDIIALRVEFVNRFNEKSEVYINDITNKWSDRRIDFSKFKKINDWQQMKTLSFSVEQWNAREKSGVIYIDSVRLLK